eukprot:2795317-Pyramimonas_sp.AAC.1
MYGVPLHGGAGNTAGQLQHTFFGSDGASSRIDYVVVVFYPKAMQHLVRGCYPLKGLGAKLQAVRGQSPRDHLP